MAVKAHEGETPFDYGGTRPDGQHEDYPVLPDAKRVAFVRPVRYAYKHVKCGVVTKMGPALAETYAADPTYYGATFCCGCGTHYAVEEFVWDGTEEKVGS